MFRSNLEVSLRNEMDEKYEKGYITGFAEEFSKTSAGSNASGDGLSL